MRGSFRFVNTLCTDSTVGRCFYNGDQGCDDDDLGFDHDYDDRCDDKPGVVAEQYHPEGERFIHNLNLAGN